MGFIIEVIFEIFLEGFVEFAKSKKAPKSFKVFVIAFFLFIAGLLLYSGYVFRDDFGLMLFMGLMSVLIFIYTIKLWLQIRF